VTSRQALARHPVSIAGALIVTASVVSFCALLVAAFAGLFENPYAGLVVFVLIPAIFVVGLLLIPAGMWLQQRKLRRDPAASADWPVLDFRQATVRRGALVFTALTAVNIIVLLLAGYGSLHWMESPAFCGQVCHTPMQPQFTAWREGSHGRIACVKCHVGEGAGAFVHAKLSGVRQLAHVATGSYPKPIPPGAEMPPGAQALTCRSCHQPGREGRDQVRAFRSYADDEPNSETVTLLHLYMGGPSSGGKSIHWHADPSVRIEYLATDAARQTIPYVRMTNAKGEVKEWVVADTPAQTISSGSLRTMDCVDCHNTVGHPISTTAERIVDNAIAAGQISRQLPFARREGVRVVQVSYPTQADGLAKIDSEFRKFYQSQNGGVDPAEVSRTVSALQSVYRRNVFPTMKVTWGSYPENRGHSDSSGCFRCHDDGHTAKDGATISGDCELCHKEIEKPPL
jgi:NapC/NirT cytochrome c family protein